MSEEYIPVVSVWWQQDRLAVFRGTRRMTFMERSGHWTIQLSFLPPIEGADYLQVIENVTDFLEGSI